MKIISKYMWKILKYLPFIQILLAFCFIIYIYYFDYLKILENNTNIVYNFSIFYNFNNKYKVCLYIISALTALILIISLKLIFTHPGRIPLDWHEKNYNLIINELMSLKSKENTNNIFKNLITVNTVKEVNSNDKDFKELLKKKNMRFCKVCKLLKPDRSHHCKQCGECILKMDHHCNWVFNCIGLFNYKYFLQLWFYFEIFLIFLCFTFTEGFLIGYLSTEVPPNKFFLICIAYILSIIYLGLISFLFGFHFFRLSNNNITTIEFCENKNKDELYNKGIIKNLLFVFGKNPILWFIPIATNYNPIENSKEEIKIIKTKINE